MQKEFELWQFVAERLQLKENVMLLVVAESKGSSPGRQGYKMAVGEDGRLFGSIGGGVMEINLVETSRRLLAGAVFGDAKESRISVPIGAASFLKLQTHRKKAVDPSGMICSGKQSIIFKMLMPSDIGTVCNALVSINNRGTNDLLLSSRSFAVLPAERATRNEDFHFEKLSEYDFEYREKLGLKNDLYIVGGGHCALALSELMSKMDFHITLFDDRVNLNTVEKNNFVDKITIVETYSDIGDRIASAQNAYVVVMTLGYKSDAESIKQLINKDFRYLGVLGSRAKMETLISELKQEGVPVGNLKKIRTPIGLQINSRTPEEIAVSIAAEIIAEKNGARERI